jgi:hypothetical protein
MKTFFIGAVVTVLFSVPVMAADGPAPFDCKPDPPDRKEGATWTIKTTFVREDGKLKAPHPVNDVYVTVAEFIAFGKQDPDKFDTENLRKKRQKSEQRNVRVTGYVQGIRCSKDGDLHIVMADVRAIMAEVRAIVAEEQAKKLKVSIPRAVSCVVTESPYPVGKDKRFLLDARKQLRRLFASLRKSKDGEWWIPANDRRVTITGSLYYDEEYFGKPADKVNASDVVPAWCDRATLWEIHPIWRISSGR